MRFVQCARDVRVTQRIVLKSTWTLVAQSHPIPSQQNLGDALGTGHPKLKAWPWPQDIYPLDPFGNLRYGKWMKMDRRSR